MKKTKSILLILLLSINIIFLFILDNYKQKNDTINKTNEKLSLILKNSTDISNALNKQKNYYTLLNIPKDNTINFISKITSFGQKNNITSLKIMPTTYETESKLKKQNISISFYSTYQKLMKVLNYIDNINRFVKINDIQLTNTNNLIKAEITVITYERT